MQHLSFEEITTNVTNAVTGSLPSTRYVNPHTQHMDKLFHLATALESVVCSLSESFDPDIADETVNMANTVIDAVAAPADLDGEPFIPERETYAQESFDNGYVTYRTYAVESIVDKIKAIMNAIISAIGASYKTIKAILDKIFDKNTARLLAVRSLLGHVRTLPNTTNQPTVSINSHHLLKLNNKVPTTAEIIKTATYTKQLSEKYLSKDVNYILKALVKSLQEIQVDIYTVHNSVTDSVSTNFNNLLTYYSGANGGIAGVPTASKITDRFSNYNIAAESDLLFGDKMMFVFAGRTANGKRGQAPAPNQHNNPASSKETIRSVQEFRLTIDFADPAHAKVESVAEYPTLSKNDLLMVLTACEGILLSIDAYKKNTGERDQMKNELVNGLKKITDSYITIPNLSQETQDKILAGSKALSKVWDRIMDGNRELITYMATTVNTLVVYAHQCVKTY